MAQLKPETVEDYARFDILLDNIPTIVMVVDNDLKIIKINAAGRSHFKMSDVGNIELNLRTFLQDHKRDFLVDACTRVLQTGLIETFELASAIYEDRILQFQLIPFPDGVAILANVVTESVRLRLVFSSAAAAELAMDANPLLGRGAVNMCGIIVSASQNLCTMTETAAERIEGMSFASIFEQKARSELRDAMERLLSSAATFCVDAIMQSGSTPNIPVTVSAAPVVDRGAIQGATFIVGKMHY